MGDTIRVINGLYWDNGPLINKPPRFNGLASRIPMQIPTKGRVLLIRGLGYNRKKLKIIP